MPKAICGKTITGKVEVAVAALDVTPAGVAVVICPVAVTRGAVTPVSGDVLKAPENVKTTGVIVGVVTAFAVTAFKLN